jgi:hypothetical protein
METRPTPTPPARPERPPASLLVLRLLLGAACASLPLLLPVSSPHPPEIPLPSLRRALVPVYAELEAPVFSCTGWWLGPGPRLTSGAASAYYVTAGHCPIPQKIPGRRGLAESILIAFVRDPGTDTTIGLAPDPDPSHVTLSLQYALPAPDEPAVAAGWPLGRYTEAVVTYAGRARGRLLFHSPIVIRKGYSGAPLVSLWSGRVLGMLVGTALHDPRMVEAIPAARIALLAAQSAPSLALPTPPLWALPSRDSSFLQPPRPAAPHAR